MLTNSEVILDAAKAILLKIAGVPHCLPGTVKNSNSARNVRMSPNESQLIKTANLMLSQAPKRPSNHSVSLRGSHDRLISRSLMLAKKWGHDIEDDVTAALKDAGLISDSPIGSPYHITEDSGIETDSVVENKDNATGCIENVLELGCHPDLDIYGDFEYDLEDVEDPATSSILNSITPAIPSKDTASKVKVVLSTGQWSKQSVNEQADGGHEKQMCVEQSTSGEPKPFVSRGEFKSEEGKDTFLTLDDMHARSAIEGSKILVSTMDKNHYAVYSPDAGRDIKSQVPNIALSEDGHSKHTLSLEGLSANSSGIQDQSSFRKNDLNQVELQINSFTCPVKDSISDSQLVSDRLSDAGDGLGLVKLPARAVRGNTQRGSPDCEKDTALFKTNKQNAEINQKVSVPIQSAGNCPKKNCEIDRNKPRPDVSHSIWKKI